MWYARAAAHGNRRAQYNLGQLYAAGDGVPRNLDQAEAWFRDAAADLPAAAEKLAAMWRGAGSGTGQTRLPASAAGEDAGPPTAPQPVAPADGSTVPALAGAPGAANTVELVWVAPAQIAPVRFFIQLLALDAAGTHEVFASNLDKTATLASLERVPGRYAWRVYAIGRDLKHYAASEWSRFEVRAPG
jgi:TPR repeat protein